MVSAGDLSRVRNDEFDEIYNFRDLNIETAGSKQHIQNHLLYRSARLDKATPADVKRLTDKYAIQCIIDLRSSGEIQKASGHSEELIETYPFRHMPHFFGEHFLEDKPFHDVDRARVNIEFIGPMFKLEQFKRHPDKVGLCKLGVSDLKHGTNSSIHCVADQVLNISGIIKQYTDFLDHCQKQIRHVLKLLTTSKGACLFHCTHGKDRTGIIAMLVLHINLASEDDIIKDYALTEHGIKPLEEATHHEMVVAMGLDEQFTTAKEQTMAQTLEYINDKYMSVDNYLCEIGFDNEWQEKMRSKYLEYNPFQ